MKVLIFLACLPLLAEDKPAPTVEQLQAQVAAKDQQIAFLQRQLVMSQREETLHRQAFQSCLDVSEQQAQQRRPTAPATQP